MLKLKIIVAVDSNNAIGFKGQMCWSVPQEMAFFKQSTLDSVLIMGRTTYDSIGKPLPRRESIVLSSRNDDIFQHPHVHRATSIEAACTLVEQNFPDTPVWVIGGANVYTQALPYANEIWMSVMPCKVEADTYFPPLNMREWQCVQETPHFEKDTHLFTVKVFKHVSP